MLNQTGAGVVQGI